MKQFKPLTLAGGVVFVLFFGLMAPTAARASEIDTLVLTPGHSQTLHFELDTILTHQSYHLCLLATLGAGKVVVRVGPASSVGEFAGMIYAVSGMIGLQPVFQHAYNAETISLTVDVPDIAFGFLVTGILTGIDGPDFPIVMSMVVSHPN